MKPFDPFEGSFKCGIAAILLSLGIGFISFALAQQGLRSPAYVAQLQKAAAGGGGYDPASDTDAIRWWRVHGTIGTNANNGAITNLIERKGIGYNWTNLSALASGPIITNNYVNGKSAARSYGTNWLLMAGDSFSGLTDLHFFVVVRSAFDDGVGNGGFWYQNGSAAPVPYYSFTDGDTYWTLATDTRKGAGNPAALIDSWRLVEVFSASGVWTLWVDGTQVYTTASNTVGFSGVAEILFSNTGTESTGWQGDIAEIIVRDAQATGATLTAIRAYFDTEYSLAY